MFPQPGGLPNAVERGVERALRRDPDLQPEPADVAADRATGRRLRRLPRGVRGLAARIGGDPRRLPDQLRLARTRRSARSRSTSLTHALRVGDGIGADGRRPPRRLAQGRPAHEAVDARGRRGDPRGRWPRPTPARSCSRTPPAPSGPLGRDFDELAELIELPAAASGSASASTAATCSPPASTSSTPRGSGRVVDDLDGNVGLERLRCLHVNDSRARSAPTATATPRRRGRDRDRGARDVPLRAPLRGPAGPARDPRARRQAGARRSPRRGSCASGASRRGGGRAASDAPASPSR